VNYNVITPRTTKDAGIQIPKPIIEQCGFGASVELSVKKQRPVVSPRRAPRQQRDEAFRAAGPSTDDELLLEDLRPSEFDRKEWEW
jgi:antitoxin MazE